MRFERDVAARRELLIILTPYIVDSDDDIRMQNQDEIDRMHWCLADLRICTRASSGLAISKAITS